MTNPLEYIGLGDGEGNISSTRVMTFLVGLSVIIPKLVNGIKTGNCQWTPDDMGMLSVAFGFKSLGAHLENKSQMTQDNQKPKQP